MTDEVEKDSDFLERVGMDADKWAAEFRKTAVKLGYSDMDEGWLASWFSNLIMAGFDEAERRRAMAYCVLCRGESEVVHIFSTKENALEFSETDDRDHIHYDYVVDHPERMEAAAN